MDLALFNAIRSGKLQKFTALASDPERNIYDEETPEGNTVLHMAARYGHLPLVEVIAGHQLYNRLVLTTNHKGETPIHIAARAGHLDVVRFFINSVNLKNIAGIKDNYGNTPLHGAVRNGHEAVVKDLAAADKESLILTNDAWESPLSIAIYLGFTEIAKSIIVLDESTLDFKGQNGQTALHYAVIRHDSDTVNAILESRNALVKVQDEKKRTPLHYAAALGYQKMVGKLLNSDASVAYIEDHNKQIPLHSAAENGHTSLLNTLLNHGPDTIEIVDKNQRNILHLAANTGNMNMVSHIMKLDRMEDLVNSPDASGNTPLHLATKNYYSDVVGVLAKNRKVEIRTLNDDDKTPLAILKSTNDREMDLRKHLTLKALKSAYKQKAINLEDILENKQTDDVVVEAEKESNADKKGREMAQTISVMSTLIATFTFTAAFTIPGGLKSDGPDEGMAALITRAAFQGFVITDTIAMTTSVTAAVIVFWSASRGDTESFMDILPFAIGLTWIALMSMTLAFVTGLFVVLQKTLWLALSVCLLGTSAPFFLYILAPLFLVAFERVFKSRTSIADRHNIVNDNPFLFIFRLLKLFCQIATRNLKNGFRFSNCKRCF